MLSCFSIGEGFLFWVKFKNMGFMGGTRYNVLNNVGEVAYIFGIPQSYTFVIPLFQGMF